MSCENAYLYSKPAEYCWAREWTLQRLPGRNLVIRVGQIQSFLLRLVHYLCGLGRLKSDLPIECVSTSDQKCISHFEDPQDALLHRSLCSNGFLAHLSVRSGPCLVFESSYCSSSRSGHIWDQNKLYLFFFGFLGINHVRYPLKH